MKAGAETALLSVWIEEGRDHFVPNQARRPTRLLLDDVAARQSYRNSNDHRA
jgi:hypothetical protein